MNYCKILRSGVSHWSATKMYSMNLVFDLDFDLDHSLDLDMSKILYGFRPQLWPRYVTWPWPWPCLSKMIDGLRFRLWSIYVKKCTWWPLTLTLTLKNWPWPVKVIMGQDRQSLSTPFLSYSSAIPIPLMQGMPAFDIWMRLSCRLSRYDGWITMFGPNGHQADQGNH